jgi:cyclophilin family peptidyl-prolyl cis-trans isomerase
MPGAFGLGENGKFRAASKSVVESRIYSSLGLLIGLTAIAIVVVGIFLFSGYSFWSSPSALPTQTPFSAELTSTPATIPTPVASTGNEGVFNGVKVLLETTMGDITLQLRSDKPITTQNFLTLVNEGAYDRTIFHRVLAEFIIQGGETSWAVPSIQDEIGDNNHNYNGTIAMSNTGDPNSATSQFFINVADNNNVVYDDGMEFDSEYAVFGRVVSGMDVVMKISRVQTQVNPDYTSENTRPVDPITLTKATVLP